MTVALIFNLIENRKVFMLLNCNCATLAIFRRFVNMLRGRFFVDTVYDNLLIVQLPVKERTITTIMRFIADETLFTY